MSFGPGCTCDIQNCTPCATKKHYFCEGGCVLRLERRVPRYEVKDSGERTVFASGMQRDTAKEKTEWALVADGPMLRRWAEHLTKGAMKYTKRNWMKAAGKEEYERFRESAFRHFMLWYYNETDEDHASGVFFNICGAEYVREKLVD